MHDWNHDGKIDLNDRFIQDDIESRNTGTGGGSAGGSGSGGSGSGGSGSGGSGSGGSGSGGCCIVILLIPVLLLFLYAASTNAPSGVYSIILFLFAVAVLLGGLV